MTAPRGRAAARPEATLAIVRIAMLAGVLAFGGVIWVLHRQPGYAPSADPAALRTLATALGVLAVVAVVALLALRAYSGRAARERARQLNVIGWALGEMTALAGGVHYFLSDDPRWYVIGLFVLVAAYVVLPIRRAG